MAKLSPRAEFVFSRLREGAFQGEGGLHAAIIEARLLHAEQLREIAARPELGQRLTEIATRRYSTKGKTAHTGR